MIDGNCKVFAITGGIGSGKSLVATKLCFIGNFNYIDVDQIAKMHLAPNSPTLELLKKAIGGQFFLDDGTLKRGDLRKAIFSNEGLRNQINEIVHPFILDTLMQKIKDLRVQSSNHVVVEVPLLYEVGWVDFFDGIIVVYADHLTCINRLIKRDNINTSEAKKAIAAQDNLAEKVFKCDYVIDNSGSFSNTILQILKLSEILHGKC